MLLHATDSSLKFSLLKSTDYIHIIYVYIVYLHSHRDQSLVRWRQHLTSGFTEIISDLRRVSRLHQSLMNTLIFIRII